MSVLVTFVYMCSTKQVLISTCERKQRKKECRLLGEVVGKVTRKGKMKEERKEVTTKTVKLTVKCYPYMFIIRIHIL